MPARKPKGKREPRPAGKPRAKAASRYDELAAQWERRQRDPDRGAGDWMVDKPDLAMDAAPFLRTLRRLGYVTQDQRYFDLHRDLIKSRLIDLKTSRREDTDELDVKIGWSRYGTTLAQPDTRTLCEQIEQYIAAGVPEREVLAEVVVVYNMNAATFYAAWKALKRLLNEYRKAVGQKPR